MQSYLFVILQIFQQMVFIDCTVLTKYTSFANVAIFNGFLCQHTNYNTHVLHIPTKFYCSFYIEEEIVCLSIDCWQQLSIASFAWLVSTCCCYWQLQFMMEFAIWMDWNNVESRFLEVHIKLVYFLCHVTHVNAIIVNILGNGFLPFFLYTVVIHWVIDLSSI